MCLHGQSSDFALYIPDSKLETDSILHLCSSIPYDFCRRWNVFLDGVSVCAFERAVGSYCQGAVYIKGVLWPC